MVVPNDTSKQAARAQVEAWRSMGGEDRLRQAMALSDAVRRVSASGVRRRHPNYSEHQVHLAVIRLVLGLELFHRCFPWTEIEP